MADNLAIRGGLTEDILSLHTFIDKPEYKAQLFKSYDMGLLYTYLLKYFMPDREMTVAASSLKSQEKNYFWATIHVGTVSSYPGSAGDPFVFTLDGTLDIDTHGNYFVRERQILNLGSVNTQIRAWIPVGGISSTGGHTPTVTITAYPLGNETFTSTTITTGDVITLGSIAAGPESTGVDSTTTGYNEYTHYTQIFKEAFLAGDDQMAQLHWVAEEGKGSWLEESAEKEFMMDFQKEDAAIWGVPNLNTSVVDASATGNAHSTAVTTNKGLWSWGNDYGYILNYDMGTGLTVDDFNKISEYYETKGITSNTCLTLLGGTLYRNMETVLKDYITGTTGALNEAFTPASGGGEKDLNMAFKRIVKGHINFPMHNCPSFNNPYFQGVAKSNAKYSGLIIPIGMAMDATTGAVPNVSVRYRGIGGYVRNNIVTLRPGAGGFLQKTQGVTYSNHRGDWSGMDWLTEAMFPVYEPWKLTLIKGI
jgi:hypothetical protein